MLSGRRLDLLDPTPVDIEIEDIAHGLARVARWNGQTVGDHPWSVAQHSLLVERPGLPDCLEINAECDDGLIMGFRHRTLPIEGVQFHPESIASEHGHALLRNFLDQMQVPA
jgi:anthranilate synthase component 2